MYTIGLDFGNWYSYPCYIRGGGGDRLGSTPVDLIPFNQNSGYPTIFFYSDRAAEETRKRNERRGRPVMALPPWCCNDADKNYAVPMDNRIRCLKRHMGEPLVLDSLHTTYNDAITQCIQYIVRAANKVLAQEEPEDPISNRISLAYPASFTAAQIRKLKECAEKATIDDGTHVEVVGMIAEPAAAALDYLTNKRDGQEDEVLVFDLGAGTLDVAIVEAFPGGRRRDDGSIYYYNVEVEDGLPDLGGSDFDKCMRSLIEEKLGAQAASVNPDELAVQPVSAKEALTDDDFYEGSFNARGSYVSYEVTRDEFERAARPLMERATKKVRDLLDRFREHNGKMPGTLVLTGGASQMPMVRSALEAAIPELADRIAFFRPSRAIAYGAARYGTPYHGADHAGQAVQMHVRHDIGVRITSFVSDREYIDTHIPAGASIPFEGDWKKYGTQNDDQTAGLLRVYEATTDGSPDQYDIDGSYKFIMSVEIEYGRPVPEGTPCEARLLLDENYMLRIEARDLSRADKPLLHNEIQLQGV